MYDLSLHILDIVENSIRAGARNVRIDIMQNTKKKRLDIIIKDDGKGMDDKEIRSACDPFFTTKKGKKVGLGISLFAQAAHATGGEIIIKSQKGKGTEVHASFNLYHPDMKPLGDMDETVRILRATHRDVTFYYIKHDKYMP
ncbi:MAG: ATP-binding protein [Spirochaetes bacterium]|nr:ATP-binding protein [Spirochaetota bacterium]